MTRLKKLNCSIIRSGTSKGVYLMEKDIPPKGAKRDRLIKAIMGTPDKRQIDGLGGADILTSKVAIIGKPSRKDADVDYTFAQVGIEEDVVSYSGNCGNISAAVGPYAIEKGFVSPAMPITHVRIHNTNINKIIKAEIPVDHDGPQWKGDFQIDGVPGTGAKITLDFSETVGSLTHHLFPTGFKSEYIEINGLGKLEVSIMDIANPVVFVKAAELGMTGTELPGEIEKDPSRIEAFEAIRGIAAVKLGFASHYQHAFDQSPFVPFFCFVGEAAPYAILGNKKKIKKNQVDLVARIVGFKKTHKAFPGTGAACLAAASQIPGTVVYDIIRSNRKKHKEKILKIGHPSGVMKVEIELDRQDNPKRAAIGSTWRKIMEGDVFIRPGALEG